MKTNIKNIRKDVLHKDWSELSSVTYDYQKSNGFWETHTREIYDRGNGVTILLYNQTQGTVILTKQFRIPTYLNGNNSGVMTETCAGKLDVTDPDECVVREVEEETGYKITSPQKIMELYMSPGSVSEIIHFYLAPYHKSQRISDGGGKDSEQENIGVIEISFDEALTWVKTGKIKDAKTVILLQYAFLNEVFSKSDLK